MSLTAEPPKDCAHCPRLNGFIADWRAREPDWFNGPVPTFIPAGGEGAVRLLVIGLAPGLRGANRTGRPFTGDFAGTLLYETLIRFGFARGTFDARPDDGLELVDAAVTNAVRCVPPENKPVGQEIRTCRETFLVPTLARFSNLRAVVTLGRIAHDSTVRALGQKLKDVPFAHGAAQDADGIRVFSSYHCSRYNTNTGVLTEAMFVEVFRAARDFLGE
ncbi:uracil-DNA glycosylase [Nitratireductor sp. GCM10026969]|uniref:uracil-DNA glycosylase n=1 Tax=Nitratireductor sp. GCM10026969 TaxID=3252645 RepID=UPI003611F259